nr:hypothetical protein [Bradyrhizobium guangdongense]
MEAGIGHAEQIEDAQLQKDIERLAGDDLHDTAEHVGRHRVFPGRTGVIGQRQLGELVDQVGERCQRIEHARLVVAFEQDRARIEDAVTETGGMGQQLADRDRALRRLDVRKTRRALLEHLAIAELRQERLDRIIEPDPAVLDQQHDRAGDEDLGVGERAEDMVGPKRRVRLAVCKADALPVDHLAPPQHRPGRTGNDLLIDVALHRRPRCGKICRPGVHVSPPNSGWDGYNEISRVMKPAAQLIPAS